MNTDIEQLAIRLQIYRNAYSEGHPKVSDLVYDNLEDTLRKLAPEHPFFSGNCGEMKSVFPKATSGEPMLSLDKITDPGVLEKFVVDHAVMVSDKVDGMSLELRYKDGILYEAVSRGRNGELGFVCTANAMNILNIPHEIPGFSGEIRGEAVMFFDDFNSYSQQQIELGEEAAKHPRNVSTGTMRQENPKIVAERKIRFLAYKILGHYEEFSTELNVMNFLSKNGFDVPSMTVYTDFSRLKNDLSTFKDRISQRQYPCDGIVISFNDRNYQRELGNSRNAPKWSCAFKFQNEVVESEVESIDWELGRTGKVIPVANITPVDIDGATISRATLHNVAYLRKHKVNVGATIAIIRSGSIIPKHVETIETTGILDIPTTCRHCNSTLVEIVNEKDEEKSSLYCVNDYCSEQKHQRILYFLQTVNIEHMGPSILKALWDAKVVRSISDIFTLKASDIANISSNGKVIGAATAKKIIESIKANKEIPIVTFISALGIPDMSTGTSERLVEKFGDMDSIIYAKKEDFVNIRDFADITVNNVYNGLKKNIDMILDVMSHVSIKTKEKVVGGKLQGLKFVITGTLEGGKRDEFEADIEAAGGELQSGVSKNTSYLIVGSEPGQSKTEKAAKLGIKTITESELLKMMS